MGRRRKFIYDHREMIINVSDIDEVVIVCPNHTVDIRGFTGGIDGQVVSIMKVHENFKLTLRHNGILIGCYPLHNIDEKDKVIHTYLTECIRYRCSDEGRYWEELQ
jgi:hypothetical protein